MISGFQQITSTLRYLYLNLQANFSLIRTIIKALAARAVGVTIDVKVVDVFKNEQRSEEFVKINPEHCIPTLVNNGYVLWESRAIATYLVSKYGKDDQLYPRDIKKRSLVDQKMYFDSTSLFPSIKAIYVPVIFDGVKVMSEAKEAELLTTLSILDVFLKDNKCLAGDNYTLADTTIAASIAALHHVDFTYLADFVNINRWFKQCRETLPGFQENEDGAKMLGEKYKSAISSRDQSRTS